MESRTRAIHVLGLESSCDDTGVAILRDDDSILSNCVHSQLKQHLHLGGIMPVIAKDFHLDNIDKTANEAFKKSNLESFAHDVNAIAVTNRPGLKFSLSVGLNYARKLAQKYSKPLIPIDHMQAHSLMPLLQNKSIRFPYLTLLISGGHSLLAIASRYNKFDILGQALDESPGELLDKVARRLKLRNLGPPFDQISGGAAIELLSFRENADRFKYFKYVPMRGVPGCDFSFSGYRNTFDDLTPMIDELWLSANRQELITELSHLCASLQRAMLIQMAKKVQRAYFYYRMKWRYLNEDVFCCDNKTNHLGHDILDKNNKDDIIDLVVSGGVAANSYFIEGLKLACGQFEPQMKLFCPTKELCSDNGLMVAWNGMLRYKDYLNNKDHFSHRSIDDSIVLDSSDMSDIAPQATCPMGTDLRMVVRQTNLKGLKLNHPEFKYVE